MSAWRMDREEAERLHRRWLGIIWTLGLAILVLSILVLLWGPR